MAKQALMFAAKLAIMAVFPLSCSEDQSAQPNRLDFSLKNSSAEIVTVTLADESSFRLLQGFCRRLSPADFPLTATFSGGSVATFNEPAHWRLAGPSQSEKSFAPCRSVEL